MKKQKSFLSKIKICLPKKILEEIEAMEWDEKWDATLATPESDAFLDRLEEEAKADRAAGKSIKYIPGKSLAELFQRQV